VGVQYQNILGVRTRTVHVCLETDVNCACPYTFAWDVANVAPKENGKRNVSTCADTHGLALGKGR
jgi:hypothetical protein